MTYGKRLNEALIHAKKTRRQLAAHLGCSPQIIGMVITGAGRIERKLSTDNHAGAASFLGISADWLLTGNGEMIGDSVIQVVQAAPDTMTQQCRDIMEMLSALPDDPFIRHTVMGQIAEVIAKARGSPTASHQEPPAYTSQAATRTG